LEFGIYTSDRILESVLYNGYTANIIYEVKFTFMIQQIKCPHCGEEIEVTETLTHQIKDEMQKEFQKQLEDKEDALLLIKKETEEDKLKAEKVYEEKLNDEKKKLWAVAVVKAEEKAKEKSNLELKDLQEQLKEKVNAVKQAEEKELEFRKKQRELEDKEKRMELEVQRKLDEERKKVEEIVRKTVGEEERMKMLEKDKQMEMLKRQIEELRRKSEQGSMQIQGEVQEEDLRNIIKSNFIYDVVEDVPTGLNGADLVQTVKSPMGQKAGIILWESKNTKTWSDGWIKKLKDDQIKTKADICILVSQALPEGISSFGVINGVWVSDYATFLPLTHVLRLQLLQIYQIKSSMEGRDEKMNVLYKYLSGPQFKNRIENIVNTFTTMKEDLEKEKRLIKKNWAKREMELERIIDNTIGMHGDLQGIMGASLPTVKSLEIDIEDQDSMELGV